MSKGQVGFYGKLPIVGDFITRRLPHDFIEVIDTWLQSGIAISKEILGDTWLDLYLTSPVWQFSFQSDVCDEHAWVGIMMPSVDRVGRYFPLVLACKVDEEKTLELVLTQSREWFTQLEQVALAGLDGEYNLEQFNEVVLAIEKPYIKKISPENKVDEVNHLLKTNLISEVKIASNQALVNALSIVMPTENNGCSLWLQMELGKVNVYKGLPTPEDYSRMIG